jgi:cephalosporin-C deacetylase
MDLARDAYGDVTEYMRFYDPVHGERRDFWEKLGYIDVQHLAPRITADVYWSTGLMDTICPPSSQYAAYNKIGSKKTMELYSNFGHEGLPYLMDKVITFFNE